MSKNTGSYMSCSASLSPLGSIRLPNLCHPVAPREERVWMDASLHPAFSVRHQNHLLPSRLLCQRRFEHTVSSYTYSWISECKAHVTVTFSNPAIVSFAPQPGKVSTNFPVRRKRGERWFTTSTLNTLESLILTLSKNITFDEVIIKYYFSLHYSFRAQFWAS